MLDDKTGTTQTIAMGPVASQLALKMLGTHGGGFFNASSAHRFENPGAHSNFLQMLPIFAIPAALCLAFGRLVGDARQGWARLAAMTPLGGALPLVLIQRGEVVFGGVGSGLYGMRVFAVMAVFIAGLMIGRQPQWQRVCRVVSQHAAFYKLLLALVMWLGRFGVIAPVLAIAGSLAAKKCLAVTPGTLPTRGPLFVGGQGQPAQKNRGRCVTAAPPGDRGGCGLPLPAVAADCGC